VANHKILVIDDSIAIRKQVQEMLPKGNFEVLEAKNGVEGLNLIRQERPNLIMLDFILPKMSGWEVYQQIQGQDDLDLIPLVVMSGRKEEVTEKLPEPFKFFEFIEKPFEQKQLIEAIKSAMVKAKQKEQEKQREKLTRPTVAPVAPSLGEGASSADIQAMEAKIAAMQAEITMLKKQMGQIMTFIKQKLK